MTRHGVIRENGGGDWHVMRAWAQRFVTVCLAGGMGLPCVASPVLAQNLVFTPVMSAGVGAHPEGLVVGDFNDDGRLDIATSNSESDDVSFLLGNGNGTFRSVYSVGVGQSPMGLVTGDLNRDGIPDLVVAEAGDDRVSVLMGKGKGRFDRPAPYPSGQGPTAVSLGDLDGDGDLDMVVVNSGRFGHYPPFSWSVLLNRGEGDFLPARRFEEQGQEGLFPTDVSLADLNGDGLPDVTVTWSQPSWRKPNGSVSVFQNQGQGRLTPWYTIPAGFTLSAVTQTDVDDDGALDLLVTSVFTDSVNVLLQRSPGRYTPPARLVAGFGPVMLACEDLNGDGPCDLITTNRTAQSVSLFRGRGDGSFQPAGQYAVGAVPTAMGIEDFDEDGLPDIVTANSGSDDVSVLLSGKAVIPSIILSTDTIRFAENGDAPAQQTLPVTVSNVGLGALRIAGVALEGPGAHAFSVDEASCVGAALATGERCALPVHFKSLAPGTHQAWLRIFDNAPGGPRMVTLRGTDAG